MTTPLDDEVRARMARPQRHRLLQGYPPLPLMRKASEGVPKKFSRALDGGLRDWQHDDGEGPSNDAVVDIDKQRPLIVGVLPHHMCTPRVEGCGFCTFPHEQHHVAMRKIVTRAVSHSTGVEQPALRGRRAHAIYFGGATANLAKPDELGAIFAALKAWLYVDNAEVTLEGVPSLFLSLLGGPLAWLASLPVGSRRVSMGVQSFDASQIARMGREAFGDERTVAKVVSKAHAKGLTASGDFLFNLPHQTLAHMLDDVQRAVNSGLDQICFYNLVLYEGLGTPWSKDPALVAAVPKNDEACENWLAVRDALMANGFVQTTLTNFERARVTKRFAYEIASFTPETYDALGVGPGAISAFVDVPKRRAIKHVNGKELGGDQDLWFPLDDEDLRLLFVTRWLSKCTIDRATYQRVFGADVVDEFKDALLACLAAGLLTIDEKSISLTPRGMFYADTVVGILAARRSAMVRAKGAGTSTMHMAVERTRFAEHDHFMG